MEMYGAQRAIDQAGNSKRAAFKMGAEEWIWNCEKEEKLECCTPWNSWE
jgi:hypothetical protein